MIRSIRNQIVLLMMGLGTLFAQTNPTDVVHLSSVTQNLKAPVRFAIDASDNIYVTDDFQKTVIKYDASGNYINTINVGVSPISIALNGSGQIFVGDKATGKIYKVETNGSASVFYSNSYLPNCMTFSPEGLLYVTDGILKRVLVLDVSGNLVQSFGQGSLVFPSSIVYDKRNSRILVSEQGGVGPGVGMSGIPLCKIWIFNLNGTLQGSFSSAGNTNGKFYRIQGMTIGKCGNLYVCDPFQGKVSIFNENNVFITRFGLFGELPGQMNVPVDVLFDSQERLIVASLNNGALEIFNVNDTLPTSNIVNSDANICNGQTANITINFTGTAPWTFTYTIDGLNPVSVTTSDNPYILSTTQAGIYEITALTDQFKTGTCFSGSAKISTNNVPTSNITVNNAVVCDGNSVDIPILFTGISPWTFTYTKDGINPTTITTANNPYILQPTEAGLYEVTALSSGGCTSSNFTGNAQVTLVEKPTAAFTTSSATICQGEVALLPVTFTGTAPWTFTYTLNDSNAVTFVTNDNYFTFTETQAGIYNIISISDAQCTNTVSQGTAEVIFKPIPTATMASLNLSVCSGYPIDIPVQFTGNGPFTFTYSVDNSFFNTVSTTEYNFNMSVNVGGTYQIVSLEGDGCIGTSFSGSSVVTLLPIPTAEFSFGNNQVNICAGQAASMPVNLTGTAPWTLTYTINNLAPITITTSDNPYILSGADGGFYEIQSVTDANCYNASTLGTPEVVITPLPEATLTNSSVTSCNGLLANIPINFNGTAPWTFVYTVDGGNPITITTSENPYYLSVNTPGVYQITGITSGSCTGTGMFGSTNLVSAELPLASFSYFSNGFEFTFSNNSMYSDTYLWNFGDGFTSTDINPIHLYIAPTVYDVSLTASNGICPDSTITQTIDLTMLTVNTTVSDKEILVYPNPSHGPITIALPQLVTSDWKVEVINAVGQVVFFGNLNKSKEYIDLTQVAPGLYSVNIISSEMSKTVKLIIK